MEQIRLSKIYPLNYIKICSGLFIPDGFRKKPFEQLSGGEKTRVLLAKSLLKNPDILLLIEKTTIKELRPTKTQPTGPTKKPNNTLKMSKIENEI